MRKERVKEYIDMNTAYPIEDMFDAGRMEIMPKSVWSALLEKEPAEPTETGKPKRSRRRMEPTLSEYRRVSRDRYGNFIFAGSH